jgi:hypothetical protein
VVKPRINLYNLGWFMQAIYGDFGDGSLLDLPHGNFISSASQVLGLSPHQVRHPPIAVKYYVEGDLYNFAAWTNQRPIGGMLKYVYFR